MLSPMLLLPLTTRTVGVQHAEAGALNVQSVATSCVGSETSSARSKRWLRCFLATVQVGLAAAVVNLGPVQVEPVLVESVLVMLEGVQLDLMVASPPSA